jgi:hypothetical protein
VLVEKRERERERKRERDGLSLEHREIVWNTREATSVKRGVSHTASLLLTSPLPSFFLLLHLEMLD